MPGKLWFFSMLWFFTLIILGRSTEASSAPTLIETDMKQDHGSMQPDRKFRDEPWGQNLILNGGFEDDLTGWTIISGQPVVVDTVWGMTPYEGNYFLYGGLNTSSWLFVIRQEIDLPAQGFTPESLDGGAQVVLNSWLRNWNPIYAWDDQVFINVTFIGAEGELSSCRTMIGGADAWVERQATELLPVGTRFLRLDIVGLWRKDNDNDSCADAVSLSLVQAVGDSPAITKAPMLQGYESDRLAVVWETDGNLCRHELEWGVESVTENSVAAIVTTVIDSEHFMHLAYLDGLAPDIEYQYRVVSGLTTSENYRFRSLPAPDSPDCQIAWLGDSQSAPTTVEQHIENIAPHDVDLLINSGDVLGDGSLLSLWQEDWWNPMSTNRFAQTVPQAVAFGNHEGENPLTYAHIVLPGNCQSIPGNGSWHSFRIGPVFIIILDTNTDNDRERPDQTDWLEAQLSSEEAQGALFRVVAFHKPPYSNLWICGTAWVLQEWVPLFQTYGVDLVISGHTHDYERGTIDGIRYLIIGGGGGALEDPDDWACNWDFDIVNVIHHFVIMDVAGGILHWRVYDLDAQLIDSFDINPFSTATPTPLSTLTPTSPPTQTVSPTPPPTPTPIFTATPSEETIVLYLDVTKQQPIDCYEPGDDFTLSIVTYNPTWRDIAADLYCALDVYGNYFFYPNWTQDLQREPRTINSAWNVDNLLSFIWPLGAGTASDLAFYAVLTQPNNFRPVSNTAVAIFCYRE